MALQVAEGAVVGEDVEAVPDALEAPARLVSTIGPVAGVLLEDRHLLIGPQRSHAGDELILGEVDVGIEHGGDELVLGVGIEVDECHHRPAARGRHVGKSASARSSIDDAVLLQVGRPRRAPIGQVDATQEGRDHLAQLGEHDVRVPTGLGQRMGPHAEQQLLVGLTGAVDADVREAGGGKQPAQGVEGLGPDRLATDEIGVARRSWETGRRSGRSSAASSSA